MTTTNLPRPKRNTTRPATRAQSARRVTTRPRTATPLPTLAPRTAQPAAHRAPSVDRRPRGHVVGHAVGEPPEEVMHRRFVGGCVGYVYPTVRYSRQVGGSAGWVQA
jgi:hypothetical protein